MNNADPESLGSPPIDPPPNDAPITQEISTHKEEFEFKSTSYSKSSLKTLQRLSILTVFLSLYQLTYGSLSLYYSPTSTGSISTLMGFISLSLSVLLAIWSTRVLDAESHKTLLSEDIVHGSWENMNRIMFLSLTFRAISSFILIPNMLTQREYMGQHLQAMGNTSGNPAYYVAAETLDNIAILVPFLEAFICITFFYGARTCFKYLKQPGQTMSRLVFVSNLVLMGSSLALLSSIRNAEGYMNYQELPNLYPSWNLTALFVVGVFSAVMTLLVWLVNFKQWRVPYVVVTGVMTSLVIGMAIFSGYSYLHTQDVNRVYGDISNLEGWAQRMVNVHKTDIEAFGCPSKYIAGPCYESLRAEPWETSLYLGSCLNVNCGSLLGGLYEKPFLEVSNWSLVSLMSSLLILIGGFYFSRNNGRDVEAQSYKKGYSWLGMLGAIALIALIATTMSSRPYIKEKGVIFTVEDFEPSIKPLEHTNAFKDITNTVFPSPSVSMFFENELLDAEDIQIMMEHEDMLFMVATSMQHAPKLPDKDVKEIIETIVFRKHKYVIIGLNQTTDNVTLEKIGEWSNSYDDFVKGFKPGVPKVGIIHLSVEKAPKLVVVVFEDAEMTALRQGLQASGKLPSRKEMEEHGVFVHFANKLEDLKIENVMRSITPEAIIRGEAKDFIKSSEARITNLLASQNRRPGEVVFDFTDPKDNIPTYEITSSGRFERIQQVFVSDLGSPLGTELFKMLAAQRYKYIIQKYNSELNQIELASTGGWNTTYDDFVSQINPHEAQVSLIYLNLEDFKKLILIIYAPEDKYPDPATVYTMFNLPPDPYNLRLLGAKVTVIRNMNELRAEHILKNIYGDHIRLLSLTAQAAPFLPSSSGSSSGSSLTRTISSGGTSKPQQSTTIKTPVSTSPRSSSSQSIWDTANIAQRAVAPPPGSMLIEDPSPDMLIDEQDPSMMIGLPSSLTPFIPGAAPAPGSSPSSSSSSLTRSISSGGTSKPQQSTTVKTPVSTSSPRSSSSQSIWDTANIAQRAVAPPPGSMLIEDPSPDMLIDEQDPSMLIGLPSSLAPFIPSAAPAPGSSPSSSSSSITRTVSSGVTSKPQQTTTVKTPVSTSSPRSSSSQSIWDTANIAQRAVAPPPGSMLIDEPSPDMLVGELGSLDGLDLYNIVNSKQHKYVILRFKKGTATPYIAKLGDECAPYKNFVHDMNSDVEQIGLVHLQLETIEKTVLIAYSPKSHKKGIISVLKDFKLPDDVEIYKNLGIILLEAHESDAVELTGVLKGIYTDKPTLYRFIEENGLQELLDDNYFVSFCGACKISREDLYLSAFEEDEFDEADELGDADTNFLFGGKMGLDLNRDIVKPIKSKRLKYIILKKDPNQKGQVYIANSGTWHATFEQFAKEFEPNESQVGFIYLEIEGIDKLVMVVYAPEAINNDENQVFKDFGVAKSAKKLENKGISIYAAHSADDLVLDKVMDGVYGPTTHNIAKLIELVESYLEESDHMNWDFSSLLEANNEPLIMAEAYNASDFQLDKDVLDALNNKKYKYMIFKHDATHDHTYLDAYGKWGSTYKDFIGDFAKKQAQVGLIYLEVEAKEYLVVIAYAPKGTGTQLLREFGFPDDLETLKRYGIRAYIAHNKKDMELPKVLEGIYNDETFVQNNPALVGLVQLDDIQLN